MHCCCLKENLVHSCIIISHMSKTLRHLLETGTNTVDFCFLLGEKDGFKVKYFKKLLSYTKQKKIIIDNSESESDVIWNTENLIWPFRVSFSWKKKKKSFYILFLNNYVSKVLVMYTGFSQKVSKWSLKDKVGFKPNNSVSRNTYTNEYNWCLKFLVRLDFSYFLVISPPPNNQLLKCPNHNVLKAKLFL